MYKRHLLHITYFLNFFLAFYAFSVTYINSSMLERFWGPSVVGFIYALAALGSIATISFIPRLLKNVGDVRWSMIVMCVGIVTSVGLAVATNPIAIVLLFVLHISCISALLVDMDVFLENTSENEESGVVRGTFLTIGNTALILSPFLIGLLLGDTENYSRVYFFSAAILIPALFILSFSYKHFKDPVYTPTPLLGALKKLIHRPALARISYINFVLRFFYAWMVIYTPLYLHTYMQMPWGEIGIIFTIMLIPFALFTLPLGTLADKVYGEKEILIAGLSILAMATIALFFIKTPSFFIWAMALLLTRVGAASVDIMNETYFFKNISPEEADMASVWRTIEPFAYIVAAIIAGILLLIIPLPFLFPVLGLVVISAIPVAVKLEDTL
ncbi:MAG: hypothetical protein RLY47_4 [Candidatus Parcubacteria bacterium]|jgi:MFS family permease